MTKGKVTVAEAMRVRAAKWFREKGYSTHHSPFLNGEEMIKITVIRQKQQWRFLWWTGRSEQRLHIGDLWIECTIIGARRRDNWVFRVYGREDFDNLRSSIGGLAEELKVDIHVRLEEEEPKSEEEDSSCYRY